MDSSGNLYQGLSERSFNELREQLGKKGEKLYQITKEQHRALAPLPRTDRKGYMRNQPCICGSGKKFKKCCW